MKVKGILFFLLPVFFNTLYSQDQKPMISITIDDPAVDSAVIMDWQAKDDAILKTFESFSIKAALFVCGKRIDSPAGKELLNRWDSRGHLICNHSYSHFYFHSPKVSLDAYENDFLRCDSIINSYSNFTKLYRYPYLKEGSTLEKRDGFRDFLRTIDYKTGYVTIDASDWYIDGRMIDTLKFDPSSDLTPYKEYYLDHIYKRALYYDSLALRLTGRHIKHTLLLHHNLINALFLGDLLKMFVDKGWVLVDAGSAFKDEIFSRFPDILPAGESIVWAIAKETGKYENSLRYPAEDGEYEEVGLNRYINSYTKK